MAKNPKSIPYVTQNENCVLCKFKGIHLQSTFSLNNLKQEDYNGKEHGFGKNDLHINTLLPITSLTLNNSLLYGTLPNIKYCN